MEDIIKNHMKIGIFIKILVMYIFYQQKQDIKNIIIKIRIKNIIMDKEKYYYILSQTSIRFLYKKLILFIKAV